MSSKIDIKAPPSVLAGTPAAPAGKAGAAQQQTQELLLESLAKSPSLGRFGTNFASTASNQLNTAGEQLNDTPAEAVPSLLAKLPSAISVANAPTVSSTNADSYSAACMEALRTSQQAGGAEAVSTYTKSFKNPALGAGVAAFVAQHKDAAQSAQVDPYGNFGADLLQQARGDYGKIAAGTAATPVAAQPAPKPEAVKPAPKPEAAKPAPKPEAMKPSPKPAAVKPAPKPVVAKPAAKPAAVKPAVGKAVGLTDAQALAQIALISADFPKGGSVAKKNTYGHAYSYDVASVLQKKAPGFAPNSTPSANQFGSFMYTLSQAQRPGSREYNPQLVAYMKANLEKAFPPVKGSMTMTAAMEQQIAIAQKLSGVTSGGKTSGTPAQQQEVYNYMVNNLIWLFSNSGNTEKGYKVPNMSRTQPSDDLQTGKIN
jgi:hypothetical protein